MAVVCTLDTSGSNELTLDVSSSGIVEDDLLIVVAAFSGTNIDPITPDAGWLIQIGAGSNADFRVQVFVGTVPASVPAAIVFVSANATMGTVIAKAIRGTDAANLVEDIDTFSDFAAPASLAISVGPVTAVRSGSYLVYAVGAQPPTQVDFEAGPTPTITEAQLGRTVSLATPIEVGLWAEPIDAETSATYTQTIGPTGAATLNGFAALFVLNSFCIDV